MDAPIASSSQNASLTNGLDDEPQLSLDEGNNVHDWARSYHGLSQQPFDKETADILMKPLAADDVEIKPGKWYPQNAPANIRRPFISTRNQIPKNSESGFWAWSLGSSS